MSSGHISCSVMTRCSQQRRKLAQIVEKGIQNSPTMNVEVAPPLVSIPEDLVKKDQQVESEHEKEKKKNDPKSKEQAQKNRVKFSRMIVFIVLCIAAGIMAIYIFESSAQSEDDDFENEVRTGG